MSCCNPDTQLNSFEVLLFNSRYVVNFVFVGEVVPAENVADYSGDQLSFTLHPGNAGDQHCLTLSTFEDDLYEGEEIFGFIVSSDSNIGIPRPKATVHLRDTNGNYCIY